MSKEDILLKQQEYIEELEYYIREMHQAIQLYNANAAKLSKIIQQYHEKGNK